MHAPLLLGYIKPYWPVRLSRLAGPGQLAVENEEREEEKKEIYVPNTKSHQSRRHLS